MVIRDFQLIQFVTIESDIKISDLDDTGNEGRSCRSERDCVIGNQTYNITLQCVDKLCKGYNEKWNLYNLERFYFKMFLLPGAPPHVLEDLENIGRKLALLLYDSKDLVRDLERVLGTLRNGQGLGMITYDITVINHRTLGIDNQEALMFTAQIFGAIIEHPTKKKLASFLLHNKLH